MPRKKKEVVVESKRDLLPPELFVIDESNDEDDSDPKALAKPYAVYTSLEDIAEDLSYTYDPGEDKQIYVTVYRVDYRASGYARAEYNLTLSPEEVHDTDPDHEKLAAEVTRRAQTDRDLVASKQREIEEAVRQRFLDELSNSAPGDDSDIGDVLGELAAQGALKRPTKKRPVKKRVAKKRTK